MLPATAGTMCPKTADTYLVGNRAVGYTYTIRLGLPKFANYV